MRKTAPKKLSLSKHTIRQLTTDAAYAVIGGKIQLSHNGICPPGNSNMASECSGCPSEGENC